ncbi:hypothetical protein NA57DRAFT_72104 [Rhizodiscina lignyota]|uniref:Uncharacterized protein n=1 Tax=Rhizodiscina lignyota TaxID=1504668 RepID=A0A9P4M9X1_9PEZI|nr:hypothetical protein NA57DRAFT_72104 [Rhizodiscina lignyota]
MAAPAGFLTGRNLALFSFLSLGSGYMILKMRTIQAKRQERVAGDLTVSASRSGGGI